jgi:site-specific DNA-cytosine methylase
MSSIVKRIFHLFGATGGGAKGFKQARVRLGAMEGRWECLGSVDIDARANEVFSRRVGVPATTLDLADRSQFIAINGHEPPAGWREATPDDMRRAAQYLRPDCIFLSAPCKGFSGLLSESKSTTAKYSAMNGLSERGLWLALEAWADDPPPIVLLENVPRMLTRGRAFVEQLTGMLQHYGYAVRETVHDCGELGGLGQSRKRCLIVARHVAQVPNVLYEPPRRPLRSVGDVIGKLWLPGDQAAGPMHRVPALQWKTWVRLAFVEAGSDWRSLGRLAVEDGVLRDYLIVPEMHRGGYGVHRWGDSTGVVASGSRPSNGAFSVADPRAPAGAAQYQQYGVLRMQDTAGAVIGVKSPGQGTFSVADVRHHGAPKHNNEFRIVPWERSAQAVTGAHGSGHCLADPRPGGEAFAKYAVTPWEGSSGTVISGSTTGQGACAVADPRPNMQRGAGDHYLTGGHYGVVPWSSSSGAVSASACHDNGRWSVADPRPMPTPSDRLVCRIQALDGTWHRPFTTLELSALQSLFDPDDPADVAAFTDAYVSQSGSDSTHREWTGNAVPPASAEAIGVEILRTLMLADAGETFQLSATPVWVRPVIAGLMQAQGDVP